MPEIVDPKGAIDPNVRIPPSVIAAGKRADELHKQVYSKPEGDETPGGEPPADPPAPVEAAPAPAPAPTPTPPPPPAAPAATDWEHKYNSMKGRFERAEEMNEHLGRQIAELQQLLSQVQAKSAEPPASQPPAQRHITEADERDYGTEFVDFARRAAREEVSQEIAALKQQVSDLTGQLRGVQGHVAKREVKDVYTVLTDEVPNWEQLNTSQEFKDWLKLTDPYSGAIRMNLLRAAFEAHDAPRVVAFFQGFLSEEAAKAPQRGEPDPKPGNKPGAKVPLETLAAPGRARSAAGATPPAEKPFFTRTQIREFYEPSLAYKWRGRDEQRAQMERQIHEATREGRILNQ